MSRKGLLKESLLAHLPTGAISQLVPDGDEDKLYDGLAEAIVDGYVQMENLAWVREPDKTAHLDLLEKEYGFLPNEQLTEAERRARIKALKYAKRGSGTAEALEEALHLAGFTSLVVREGRQSQDPDGVVPTYGEYVVNGFEHLTIIGYDVGCQDKKIVLPEPLPKYQIGCKAIGGSPVSYGCLKLDQVFIYIPWDPSTNWNLVFFVADDIVLDGSGYVTSMSEAHISRYYRQIIREIILRLKPVHTWAYLAVEWLDPAGYGFGFFPMGLSPHGL